MSTSSISIMIVEDNPELGQLYERILALKGYSVLHHSDNGQDAIEFYKAISEYPALILMDYRMPVKDGLTASLEILRMNPDQRILIVSADASIQSDISYSTSMQFLKKPFQIMELLQRVANMIP